MSNKAHRRLHDFVPVLMIVGLTLLLPIWVRSTQATQPQQQNPDVQLLKAKVAQATRMLVRAGLMESSGHVSMRIPGTNRVVLGDRDTSRAILQPEDLITVDLDAKKVDGKGVPPRETEIHTGVYRARPDVMSVIHTHPTHSAVFTITGKPIVPVTVHGAIFGKGVPVFQHVGHVNSRELGDGMARALGDKQAVLLKMHGAVVVAPTVERAFAYALHLEENAEKQLWAQATGTVTPMTQQEMEHCIEVAFGDTSIQKIWDHHAAKEAGAATGSH